MTHPSTHTADHAVTRVSRWLSTSVFAMGEGIGRWILFTVQTIVHLPYTVRHYRKQTTKTMNSMAWGRGSIIVDGGVIPLLVILGVAIGVAVAIEAYNTLNLIGFGPLTGGSPKRSTPPKPLVSGPFRSSSGPVWSAACCASFRATC